MTDVILKPCPFCGGEPQCNGAPNGIMGQIYCDGEECFGPRTTSLTKQDSIVQWNTRAPASSEVREALAQIQKIALAGFKGDEDESSALSEIHNIALAVLARSTDQAKG